MPENTLVEIVKNYFPMSWTSFGGPHAHIAIFHEHFVTKKQWLSDTTFTEIFAISQALPGPASTQVAYAIALIRGGPVAGLLSHLIWVLPGMLMMIGFAYGIDYIGETLPRFLSSTVNGLTSAAVGLVALAAFKLGSKVLSDSVSIWIGTMTAAVAICYTSPWLFPVLMIAGGLITVIHDAFLKQTPNQQSETEINEIIVEEEAEKAPNEYYSRKVAIGVLMIWLLLLIAAIVVNQFKFPRPVEVFSTLYYVGSIIFGGGPVVIPLLQNYVVQAGWMNNQEFLIGLALINSMPGPNFNLGAFCGALALRGSPVMFLGGVLGVIGIFLPGILLMTGLIPFWRQFRKLKTVQSIFKGVNAGAVGLVFAAVYLLSMKSVIVTTINANAVGKLVDFPVYTAIAIATFSAAGFNNIPAPLTIFLGGLIGLIDWAIRGAK